MLQFGQHNTNIAPVPFGNTRVTLDELLNIGDNGLEDGEVGWAVMSQQAANKVGNVGKHVFVHINLFFNTFLLLFVSFCLSI